MTWHAVWAVIWGATWGNNMAAIEWGAAGGITALLFRPLLRRAWAWLRRELGAEAHEEAKAARRIAADLFEHHTGRAHPDAPGSEGEVR